MECTAAGAFEEKAFLPFSMPTCLVLKGFALKRLLFMPFLGTDCLWEMMRPSSDRLSFPIVPACGKAFKNSFFHKTNFSRVAFLHHLFYPNLPLLFQLDKNCCQELFLFTARKRAQVAGKPLSVAKMQHKMSAICGLFLISDAKLRLPPFTQKGSKILSSAIM